MCVQVSVASYCKGKSKHLSIAWTYNESKAAVGFLTIIAINCMHGVITTLVHIKPSYINFIYILST